MKVLLALIVYVLVAGLYIIICSLTFDPDKVEYNVDDYGNVYELTEEERIEGIILVGILWPIFVPLYILVGPIILLETLTKKIIEKRKNKFNN